MSLQSKNFGAVSCEPCKAFFRRNALKTTLICHYDNKCKIDSVTRKFCPKCRLDKCLAIGMRQDWLLNEEDREMKRLKILINKKRKNSSSNTHISDESIKSLPDTYYGHQILNTNNTTYNDILNEILEDNNISTDALSEQIRDIDSTVTNGFIDNIVDNSLNNSTNLPNNQQISINSNNSQIGYNVSNETIEKAVEFAYRVIPIARPLSECNTGFNEKETYLMNELMTCTQFMYTPKSNTNKYLDNMYDFHKSLNIKYDRCIRNVIKAVKGLSAFRDVCESDQISLLKYGCFEVTFLRSIMFFDYTNNSLKISMDQDHSIMSSIVMFNPDNPNLANRDYVKYLQLKYRSECEAKSRFLRLMNVITGLNVLREAQRKLIMEETPKTLIQPLLQEVFDDT
ncbi:unnamed protein product [Oppiella nova]|uniref:Uncharacterized protein n=1 Tax=Oppiella nova TaxID=334625 RepID=A0A7R9LG78_9ACAR|nr:unnamed protein product [Oppiella nova]CAG2162609.1 unnamed protein product [Oppiella nova]